MNAVVVEIKKNRAAVLSENGCVVTVKNNRYEIGQVIQMTNSKVQFTKKIAVFAASAAAFVVLGTGAWAYATPYAYVSVDVNPSIEYTVNRFDRVLSVKAVNDDGVEILQEIALEDLENQTIEAALLKTVEQITAAGYFKEAAEGGIVITTASENNEKAEELATDLQQAVEEVITEAEENIVVEAYSVGLERVEEARELGVTPGKLNLVEKLQASSSDPDAVNIEEWLGKSVKDIMKATKDNRKASVVSGSAITIDEKATDKATKEQAKDEKRQEREEEKQQKEEDKSIKKSEAKKNDVNEDDVNDTSGKDNKKASDKKDKVEKQSSKDTKKSDTTQGQTSKKVDDTSLKKEKSNSSDKADTSGTQEEDKKDASKKSSSSGNEETDDGSDSKQNKDSNLVNNNSNIPGDNSTSTGQDSKNNEGSGNSEDSNKGSGKSK